MFTFLRKIRRSFIESESAKKYFVYATGEIFLVVIGILLALQINNWNEERKLRLKSHQILQEIRENITYNTNRFEEEIQEENTVINSIDIVLDNLQHAKGYHDSLDFHFLMTAYFPSPVHKSAGYENLKDHGVDIIQSVPLKTAIIDLYEGYYAKLNDVTRISYDNAANSIWPLYTQLFKTAPTTPNQPFSSLRVIPFDYESLLKSQHYQGLVSWWRHSRVVAIECRLDAIERHKAILLEIDDELSN